MSTGDHLTLGGVVEMLKGLGLKGDYDHGERRHVFTLAGDQVAFIQRAGQGFVLELFFPRTRKRNVLRQTKNASGFHLHMFGKGGASRATATKMIRESVERIMVQAFASPDARCRYAGEGNHVPE